MNAAAPVSIVALVTHARHVAATEREQFATALRDGPTSSVFVLATCHRVEAYLTSADEAARLALALPSGGRVLIGDAAVRHAMTVAVGRDSVVVGEDQILHQLRVAVDTTRSAGALDPALERLFALALQAGRRARSWRRRPSLSLADVALASIESHAGPIQGRDVLVVGAGQIARLATTAAVAAGAVVAVANRSTERAATLAASAGTRIERFDPGPGIGAFAGVVVAIAGPWPIGPATMDALATSRTIVVDLSVPAAVPRRAAEILGGRLVTADALALVDSELATLGAPVDRLDALADRSTADFVAWLRGRDRRTAAQALVSRADREREAELLALWRRLPDLEPEARDAIAQMTRHLATRLLREPLERLGRDSDGRAERTIREIFAL